MKDLGVIKEREDLFRNCHDYITYGTLKDCSENEELVVKSLGHHAAYFGYSDYGGDIVDRIAIAALVREHGDEIMHEDTAYSGEQTIVVGTLADDIVASLGDPYRIADAIGFDLDEEVTKVEDELIRSAVALMMDDFKREYDCTADDEDFLYEWLTENGQPTATSWDFNSRECEEAFQEHKGVSPKSESANSDFQVARLVCNGDGGICTILLDDGDTIEMGSREDAQRFCEGHGIRLLTESRSSVNEGAFDDYPTFDEYFRSYVGAKTKDMKKSVKALQSIVDEHIPSDDLEGKDAANALIGEILANLSAFSEMLDNHRENDRVGEE